MTDAERNRIIGEVVSELAEKKRTLACLEAKAEAMALQFGLLCNWLNGHVPSGVELQEGLSVQDALDVVESIKATRQRVDKLEAKRTQLGV